MGIRVRVSLSIWDGRDWRLGVLSHYHHACSYDTHAVWVRDLDNRAPVFIRLILSSVVLYLHRESKIQHILSCHSAWAVST